MHVLALATFALVATATAIVYWMLSAALARTTEPTRAQRLQRARRGVLTHGAIFAVCALAAGFLPLPF